ncbi:isoaspartyl peptidase/L-asparaginase family protein [Pseudidiomarina donghaiensis]|uniref:Isoaspartyl peptidase n=1 Tax=Pseudidiomarina donghaiensis TaxID=519452 RepID=A0A432XMP8_9GAMM|nr:isoaspartyl peptidase/L-asparaginase [Pseudidiomarina donghaiensis]RUO49978.1 isoaspartyl peptidase/L-asparaginase [Pseudidiomarina donghaiensis]SFV22263.1 beta-aspartyl-peptidase (threonine type) [Pseudidiomarina donghaiensis]
MKRLLLTAALALASGQAVAADNFAIAIHGGAGTITRDSMTPEREAQYEAKLQEAVNAGYAVLEKGGDSMDAIVVAIQILEDSPLFNAGRGAVYTWDGHHELDASIMNGATREAGAVASVKTVKSPIALAREVMEESVHVMLSGEGAEAFGKQQGLELVDNSYFNTDARFKALQRMKKQVGNPQDKTAWAHMDDNFKYGTVGAVALDKHGNLAAGTSTGGMTGKRWGRIGDAPIIGAGTWADNDSCAVSATGHGEYFIRYHVAADVCSRMKYQQLDVVTAGDTVIHDVLLPAGGTGGVIIVDKDGNVHMPFNTEGMYRAKRQAGGQAEVAIYKD